jgi:hypothetical protein
MMGQKTLRMLFATAMGILIALLSSLAEAVTNYTDMWFNASESGWG